MRNWSPKLSNKKLSQTSDVRPRLGSQLRTSDYRGGSRGGEGARAPVRFYAPNFLKIEIIGFCLTTSSHKSNFYANHAHNTYHAQNWSVEPLPDFRLDPPLDYSVYLDRMLIVMMFGPSQ